MQVFESMRIEKKNFGGGQTTLLENDPDGRTTDAGRLKYRSEPEM